MKIEDFPKLEEITPSQVREGDWVVWETNGLGITSPQVLNVQKIIPGGEHCINPLTNHRCNTSFLTQSKYAQIYADHGRSSKLWRTRGIEGWVWKPSMSQIVAENWNGPAMNSGTDPEVFVEDSAGNVIPAWVFLPAKKDSPNLFWDGFQAEFTAVPSSCQDRLGQNIRSQLSYLKSKLPSGAHLSARSVVEIPKSILRSAATEHVDFGCRPSLNAYGLSGRVVPDPRELGIRFAGGHIHWGFYKKDYPEARIADAIKLVDATIGLIGVSLAEGRDDPRRREFYGLAGEFRLPAHGVEYRTLSNFWLASPSVYHLIFTLGRAAFRLGLMGMREKVFRSPESMVVQAINNTDARLARILIEENSEYFHELILSQFGDGYRKFTYARILRPLDSWPIRLEDISTNWETLHWSRTNADYPQRWATYCKLELEKALGIAKATESKAVPAVSGDAVNPHPNRPESGRSVPGL